MTLAVGLVADDEKPGVKPDPIAVRSLVEQLAHKDFATRERASRELAKLEEVPESLRKASRCHTVW